LPPVFGAWPTQRFRWPHFLQCLSALAPQAALTNLNFFWLALTVLGIFAHRDREKRFRGNI
jgi:hypothetical protein